MEWGGCLTLPRAGRGDAAAGGVFPGLVQELEQGEIEVGALAAEGDGAETVAEDGEAVEGALEGAGEVDLETVMLAVVEEGAAHAPEDDLGGLG